MAAPDVAAPARRCAKRYGFPEQFQKYGRPRIVRNYQGLKPYAVRHGTARLKSCPDTEPVIRKHAPHCIGARRRRKPRPQFLHFRHTARRAAMAAPDVAAPARRCAKRCGFPEQFQNTAGHRPFAIFRV